MRHVESEIGPAKRPHGFQDYHPNHAVYVAAQNMVSYLAEEMSALPELHEYAEIVGQAEDEYMPEWPAIQPAQQVLLYHLGLFRRTLWPGSGNNRHLPAGHRA